MSPSTETADPKWLTDILSSASASSVPKNTDSKSSAESLGEQYDCSLWTYFDKLQICYTLIPQLKHYYRYGELKSCEKQYEDLKFCYSNRKKPTEEARQRYKERLDENWSRKRFERSSVVDGVWKTRNTPPSEFPPSLETVKVLVEELNNNTSPKLTSSAENENR